MDYKKMLKYARDVLDSGRDIWVASSMFRDTQIAIDADVNDLIWTMEREGNVARGDVELVLELIEAALDETD